MFDEPRHNRAASAANNPSRSGDENILNISNMYQIEYAQWEAASVQVTVLRLRHKTAERWDLHAWRGVTIGQWARFVCSVSARQRRGTRPYGYDWHIQTELQCAWRLCVHLLLQTGGQGM
jgi:hypothetical protein